MLINRRNAMMAGKRLPYDAEIEYLESTGTQWIDTGILLSSDHRVVCDVVLQNSVRGSAYAFGAWGDGANFGVNVDTTNAPNAEYCVWASRSDITGNDLKGVRQVLDLSKDGLFRDGVKVHTPSGTFTGKKTAYLFWANGTGQGLTLGKIYSAKIYDANGALVRDYIPVRKDGIGEMYDRVSGTFAERHGTFLYGPDASASNGGGYKLTCPRRSYRRSSRPSARFWQPRLWKEVA